MTEKHRVSLSPAEWNLMEYLWDHVPCTGREAAQHCAATIGWSRTTTLTVLRHLVEKGAVTCDESGKRNTYAPCIDREDTMMQETDDFLQRIYKGSVSMMLSAMTKKQQLSQKEISELRAILVEAEQEGGK